MKSLVTCNTNYTELKEKIKKLLLKDSRKVDYLDSDLHEFAFKCANSSFPQQLKSDTLEEISRVCKPYSIKYVINSVDQHTLVIYFW